MIISRKSKTQQKAILQKKSKRIQRKKTKNRTSSQKQTKNLTPRTKRIALLQGRRGSLHHQLSKLGKGDEAGLLGAEEEEVWISRKPQRKSREEGKEVSKNWNKWKRTSRY